MKVIVEFANKVLTPKVKGDFKGILKERELHNAEGILKVIGVGDAGGLGGY